MGNEKINIGDRVRSFDVSGNDHSYVEGVVTDIVEVHGIPRYEIKVERRVHEGKVDNDPAWRESPVYPPVNGSTITDGAVSNLVKKI